MLALLPRLIELPEPSGGCAGIDDPGAIPLRLELLSRRAARPDAAGGDMANALVRDRDDGSPRSWLVAVTESARDLKLDIELVLTFRETEARSRCSIAAGRVSRSSLLNLLTAGVISRKCPFG